jgi:hypothetical protein
MIALTKSKNDPGDLQILHANRVPRLYKASRGGGSATSPYVPLFLNYLSAIDSTRENDVKVSPTTVVFRPDGTRGVIDMVELFTELGFL